MTIEECIKKNVTKLGDKVFIAPNIPTKKLDNAIKSMAEDVNPDYVVAIVDDTLFGSAKDGLLFTGAKLYAHALGGKKIDLSLERITSCKYDSYTVKKDDKEKVVETVSVGFDDGTTNDIESLLGGINLEEFCNLLNEIISLKDEGH